MSRLRTNEISARTGSGNINVVGGKLVSPGSVLQVVSTTFSGTWAAGGSGTTFYTVTDLNTNITPISTTSKVLVSATLNIGSGYWEIQGRFMRNGVAIGLGTQRGVRSTCTFVDNRFHDSAQRNGWGAVTANYLDSPNTTAQQTYSVALNAYGTYTVAVNYNPYTDPNDADYFGCPISTLTLMEIAQ